MFQRFRFPDAVERVIPQDVLDQEVDPLEPSSVLALPVEVVFPAAGSQASVPSLTGEVVLGDDS